MNMTNILSYLENTMADGDKAAFVCENFTLSFRDLRQYSRAVGTFLVKKKIKKQAVVVFMEKSAFVPAALFGVVYSGNYYVPIDREMPTVRLTKILETVKPALIICDATTKPIADEWEYESVLFDEVRETEIDETALQAVRAVAVDTDPLYVVFTSGSTGMPKGVVAAHRSVIDYIEQLSPVLGVDETTIFGNQSPFYLDACLKELLPAIKFGATTFIIPKQLFMFPVRLIEFLNEKKINTICWVASALALVAGFNVLEKLQPLHLRCVAFGSEVFRPKHLNAWRNACPEAKFVHLYGPTEATGMSVYHIVEKNYGANEAIPIGRAFSNTEVLLLDNNKTPEVGDLGEICIRGAGLCLGYFGDKEKTATVFVQNPLSAFPDIIYRTGDLGYMDEAGLLYFSSRKDHQIKHMGYRIELAEIELAASSIQGVALACCTFDEAKSRITLHFTGEAETAAISRELKLMLPRYMLPYSVVKLENMPLTAGGKIDRKALERK